MPHAPSNSKIHIAVLPKKYDMLLHFLHLELNNKPSIIYVLLRSTSILHHLIMMMLQQYLCYNHRSNCFKQLSKVAAMPSASQQNRIATMSTSPNSSSSSSLLWQNNIRKSGHSSSSSSSSSLIMYVNETKNYNQLEIQRQVHNSTIRQKAAVSNNNNNNNNDVHVTLETASSSSNNNNKSTLSTNNGRIDDDSSSDNGNSSSCSQGTPMDEDDDDEEDEQEEMFVTADPVLGLGTIKEWGGPRRGGRLAEPTRFGDWERKGRCTDF